MISSTLVRLADDNCGYALQLYREGAPMDTELFQYGKAAHAALEQITIKQPKEGDGAALDLIGRATMEELLRHGTEWMGRPEPPMAPKHATVGRDLALAYVRARGVPPPGQTEVGLAMDVQGKLVPYGSPEAVYGAKIDLVYETQGGDEDNPIQIAVSRDYKGAWPTDEEELETNQIRGQAVLVAKAFPEAAAVRREVVNLRKMTTYEEELYLDEDGIALLAEWEKDLLMIASALAEPDHAPRPGANCVGCPFAGSCVHVYQASLVESPVTPADIALAFATADARRQFLFGLAKAATKEDPVEIEGGFVGMKQGTKRVLAGVAIPAILDEARLDPEDPMLRGLLDALSLGSSNVESFWKRAMPERNQAKERNELIDQCLDKAIDARFGVHKEKK